MTKIECINCYDQIISVAREIENIKEGLMNVLGGGSIDRFDEIHDRLANTIFQMIMSVKFGDEQVSEWTKYQFTARYMDTHMENYLYLVTAGTHEDRTRVEKITEMVEKILE